MLSDCACPATAGVTHICGKEALQLGPMCCIDGCAVTTFINTLHPLYCSLSDKGV